MSEHAHAGHDSAHGHAAEGHAESTHHVVPVSLYLKVFTALMVLLVITLAAAAFDLSHIWGPLNVIIAVTIAVVKAVLIILYFMHVRYSSKLTWFFAGAAFLWLIVMFSFTFSDYMTRNWMPSPSSWSEPG